MVACLGFVPASTLGISACPDGARTLQSGGATLFVAGSALYLAGSLLIFIYQAWSTYRTTSSGGGGGGGGGGGSGGGGEATAVTQRLGAVVGGDAMLGADAVEVRE